MYMLLFIWSVINPKDYQIWFFEAIPCVIGLIILWKTYSVTQFSTTAYVWCFIAATLMTIGSHYTYAEVPLFNWIKESFDLQRNNYDKLGHFVQGIVPVLIMQELMVKRLRLFNLFWINLISLFTSIAISAIYEIVEWGTVYWEPGTAELFLGAQGYFWDAQSDMFFASLGAFSAIIFLKRVREMIQINALSD
jgi:putative membrane protein